MAHRVFISFRIHEDSDGAAVQLRDALEKAGISSFLCGDQTVGEDLAAHIAAALDACELFLVLGTKGFGGEGASVFSTRQELQFAMGHRKPIFLIRRCDDAFVASLTRFYLPASMLHVEWQPLTPMPKDLVGSIKAKLQEVGEPHVTEDTAKEM
jgi:hypothetical protein